MSFLYVSINASGEINYSNPVAENILCLSGREIRNRSYREIFHFVDTDRPFANAAEVTRELRRHLPTYHKSQDVVAGVIDLVGTAVQRAERCWSRMADSNDEFPNPCTLVHLLVTALQEMASPGRSRG